MNDVERMAVCYHEIGHVVVGEAVGVTCEGVSVFDENDAKRYNALGSTHELPGTLQIAREIIAFHPVPYRLRWLRSQAISLAAGCVTEGMYNVTRDWDSVDLLEHGASYFRGGQGDLELYERLQSAVFPDWDGVQSDDFYGDAHYAAIQIAGSKWRHISTLAQLLNVHGRLTKYDIRDVVEGTPSSDPPRAIRDAMVYWE